MNLKDFENLYGHMSQKTKVLVICESNVGGKNCNKTRIITKEKAIENIKTHDDIYICRSCVAILNHKNKPRDESVKEKQRIGRKGKKHTEETKKRLSEWRKKFFLTPEGLKLRKSLAKKAVAQHAKTNLNKSTRIVFYISAKNNGEIRVCASSGEYIICEDFLEKDPNVISYETQVGYEVHGRSRSLDILVHYKDNTKKVIEFKPVRRLTEVKNILQIADCEDNARNNGWKFELWTEKDINVTNWKNATARADAYKKQHYFIDHALYRKQKNKEKSDRHGEKLKKDIIIIYCEFCETYHSRRRDTYNKNIEKNGKFICIRENGRLSGKKPKLYLRKDNAYADMKHKECTCCKRVLSFECFSPDKSRRDGISSRCKECRAKIYREKYQKEKNNGQTNAD